MGDEQLLQVDSGSFFRRPSPLGFAEAGLLICSAGLFRFCDNLHTHASAVIEGFQLLNGRHRKEIPVQQEQGDPKSADSMIGILHHLDYMGSSRNRCPFPFPGSLEPVMKPDGQKDAGPVAGIPSQDDKAAEHVPVDVFRLRGSPRFLEQLLHTWHAAPFLGLFYSVAYEYMEVPFFNKESYTALQQKTSVSGSPPATRRTL